MSRFKLTDVCFQAGMMPYAPTLEGQYIIKNIVLNAAALLLGDSENQKNFYT